MSTENLYNEEARKKLKEMVEDIDFCMMATGLTQKPLHVIPMSTKEVDSEGAIWFLSSKESDHNANIRQDDDIQLIYALPSKMEFLNLYGKAAIKTDRPLLETLYSDVDDTWFDGVDDPNLTAIQFKPQHAYYWDTKSNMFVTMFKMGYGAVTGDQADVGEEGKLDV